MNMPGEISPVRPVRETLQDRVGRKYKDTINEKVAQNVGGKNSQTVLGYQQNQEEQARFKELMREKKEKQVDKNLVGFIAETQAKAINQQKASAQVAQPVAIK